MGAEVVEVETRPRDADVLFLNGVQWRALVGPPPWAGGPGGTAPAGDTPAPVGTTPTVVETTTTVPAAPPDTGTIEGELTRCGDERCVGGTSVDSGPWWYLSENLAAAGDGTVETGTSELEGLAGTAVTVQVELGSGDPDVFVLNGVAWRPLEGPPPWAGGPLRGDDDNPVGPPNHAGPPDRAGPPDHAGPPEGPPGDSGGDPQPTVSRAPFLQMVPVLRTMPVLRIMPVAPETAGRDHPRDMPTGKRLT